jgi:hypothetical protein
MNRASKRRWSGWVAAIGLVVVLAGCSQTAALAPVGGDRLAEARFAANDVLLTHNVSLLTAPVCTSSGKDDAAIACTGRTLDQQTITVTSTAKDQANMTVVVGTQTIYHGSFMAVLNANAQPTS